MKATKVDGVYDADPKKNPSAKKFESLKYIDVLSKGLQVMDSTAISLCMDHALPILVFDYRREGNIVRAIAGERLMPAPQQTSVGVPARRNVATVSTAARSR